MQSTESRTEHRRSVRLAGATKEVEVVVVDRYDQPIELLSEVRVLNVSAGGLAMASDLPVQAGARMKIVTGGEARFHDEGAAVTVTALECTADHRGKFVTRCQLIRGGMPAELIYGW